MRRNRPCNIMKPSQYKCSTYAEAFLSQPPEGRHLLIQCRYLKIKITQLTRVYLNSHLQDLTMFLQLTILQFVACIPETNLLFTVVVLFLRKVFFLTFCRLSARNEWIFQLTWGSIHSSLVPVNAFINKNKHLNQMRTAVLVRWLPSVNIWCTKCTALGTLATYVL